MSATTISSEPDPRRRVRVWKEIEGEEPWYSFTVDTPEGERVREGGSATLAGVAASLRHVVMLDNLFAPMLALAEMKGAGEFVELAFPPLVLSSLFSEQPFRKKLREIGAELQMGAVAPLASVSPFAGLLTRAEAERLVIQWGLRDDPKLCNAVPPKGEGLEGKCVLRKDHLGGHESRHGAGGEEPWGIRPPLMICGNRREGFGVPPLICDRRVGHEGAHAVRPNNGGGILHSWSSPFERNPTEVCPEVEPGTGTGCTLPKGHQSGHECSGRMGQGDGWEVVAQWPKASPVEICCEPDPTAELGFCGRERDHDGDHQSSRHSWPVAEPRKPHRPKDPAAGAEPA